MGFKPGKSDIPNSMIPLVEEMIETGRNLTIPQACYDFRPIRFTRPDRIDVEERFSIQSRRLFRWMEGCSGMYSAAVTLGPGLDQEVARLANSSDMTRAFLLNAYGAEAAEALMKSLNDRINAMAKDQGYETTKRYSPGYGDWHISGQAELLGDLGVDQIGIRLTENYMMIPEKSVSAVIGRRSISGGTQP